MTKPTMVYRLNVGGKFYIGASKTSGMRSKWIRKAQKTQQRQNSLTALEQDILQTPREKIRVMVLETLDDEILVEARVAYWIEKFNTRPPHGYNVRYGDQP